MYIWESPTTIWHTPDLRKGQAGKPVPRSATIGVRTPIRQKVDGYSWVAPISQGRHIRYNLNVYLFLVPRSSPTKIHPEPARVRANTRYWRTNQPRPFMHQNKSKTLFAPISHPLADFFDTALFGAVFVSYSGQQRLGPRGPLRRRQPPSPQVKHHVRRLPRLEKHPLRQSPRALVRPGAPVNDLDNGWRFFSELADDLFDSPCG